MELTRIVDRYFYPKDGTFIVHIKRVLLNPMLDSPGKGIPDTLPATMSKLVTQLLGCFKVVYLEETVLLANIVYPLLVHLSGQPLPS